MHTHSKKKTFLPHASEIKARNEKKTLKIYIVYISMLTKGRNTEDLWGL